MARGSISVYDGPRGRVYRAAVDAGKNPDGSRHQLRRSFRTKRLAEQWLAKTIAAAESKAAGEPSREPLGEYLSRWLDTLTHSGIKPATEYRYRLVCAKRFGGILAVELRKLTPALIEAHYATLTGTVSPATVTQAHAVLRRAMDAAVRLGEIPVNPCLSVKLPKQRRFHPTTWTVEQVRRFLAAAGDDLYGVYWRVAMETMAREGELLALRWESVDLEAGNIAVRETRTADRVGRAAIGSPKTEAGRRTIELSRGTVDVLRRHLARQAERRRHDPEWNAAGFLFPNRVGGTVNSAQVGRRLHRACRELGLPALRVHDLRHTGATLAIVNGVPVKTVSERLGHRDVMVTLRMYVHPSRDDHRVAAEKIAGIFAAREDHGDTLVTPSRRTKAKNRIVRPRPRK